MVFWKRKQDIGASDRDESPEDSNGNDKRRRNNAHDTDYAIEEQLGWIGYIVSMFSLPYDWYLSINEDIAVIDWDSKSKSVAWPLGNVFTFLFFAIRLLQDNLINPNINKLDHSDDAFDFSKSKNLEKYDYFHRFQGPASASDNLYYKMLRQLHRFFNLLTFLLILINLYVTYSYLFANYQTYSIFYWKTPPRSKNVTKKSLNDLDYTYVEDAQRDSLWGMLKYLLFSKNRDDDVSNKSYYYEMRKWAPSKFLTALFVSFSPIVYSFIWLTDVSFKTLIPIFIHQYVLWFVVIERYEQKTKDEQLLCMANVAEMDSKVIQPKMNTLKQDAMIDATPYGDNVVYFYPSYTTTRSRVFSTHSLTGELVKEKYNPRTDSFEDSKPQRTQNYVRLTNHHQYKTINGAYVREPYESRQPSPRLSPSRIVRVQGGHTPSAPSTPLLIPSQQPHFDHSMLANASRTNIAGVDRRHSQSPVKQHLATRTMQYPDETNFSMDQFNDDRYGLLDHTVRGREGYSPNRQGETESHSPFRHSPHSPFR